MQKYDIKNRIGFIVEKQFIGTSYCAEKNEKVFHCSCGNIFVAKTTCDMPHMISVRCNKCHNNSFLSNNLFAYKKASIYMDHISFRYDYTKSDNKWSVSISANLPSYDMATQKVFYRYIPIYYMRATIDGKTLFCSFDTALHTDTEIWLKDKAIKLLIAYMRKNLPSRLSFMDCGLIKQIERRDALSAIKIMLDILKYNNIHLIMKPILENMIKNSSIAFEIEEKHFHKPIAEYISNFSTKKSVKRLIYQGILSANKSGKTYNIVVDFIVCRVFDDENIICALLSDFDFKNDIFDFYIDKLCYQKIIQFVKWLKTIYSELSISKAIKGDHLLWKDIFMMIQSLSLKEIASNYTKVSMSSKNIHDEILRIKNITELSKMKEENTKFDYKDSFLYGEKEYMGLKFKLPKDRKTLKYWALLLQNCMYAYAPNIEFGKCAIFGVFRDDKLLYALEIDADSIVQARGAKNTSVPKSDMEIIDLWFQKYLLSYKNYGLPINKQEIEEMIKNIENRVRLIEAPKIKQGSI